MGLPRRVDEPVREPRAAVGVAKRPWRPLVLALVLVAVGVAGLAASSGVAGPAARLVGGNVPIGSGATDRLDVRAHNSPTLVANPKDAANLVLVNRVDHPHFSCSLHVSFDGGSTWAGNRIPSPDGRTTPCFSPDVAFGPDGILYVSFTSFAPIDGVGTAPDTVWVGTSTDGGRTISPPVAATGPFAYQVRLAADPSRAGRVYLTWVAARETLRWGFVDNAANPVLASRSDDGGAVWSAPVRVSAPARRRVVGPAPAVGPEGVLYVAYLDVGDDRLDYTGAHEGRGGEPHPGPWSLVVARSSDAGATWSQAVAGEALVPGRRFIQIFAPSPSVAVAGDGRVYAAFEDGRMGDADVWLWSSADSGRVWTRGRRVNDTPPGDGRSQYLPEVAASPGGRLDVVYYDRRSDPENLSNSVSLQSSFDGGRTFTASLALTDRPFDSRIGLGRERGMADLGSRLALLSTDAGALAVWTDTRAGNPDLPKQVLARSIVRISPAASARPLRPMFMGLSIALVGLAAALCVRWWLLRRSGSPAGTDATARAPA